MPHHNPVIIEHHVIGDLHLLRLLAPEIAIAAQPGQYVLASGKHATSHDPLLRRALFIAGANPREGTLDLLVQPDERGKVWICDQQVGAHLDLLGPQGRAFRLDPRTRNLLLAGTGTALPALLFLAHQAASKGIAGVLFAAASAADLLPPAFLLPPEFEYQSSADGAASLIDLLAAPKIGQSLFNTPIAWADQICFALSENLIAPAAAAVRNGRMRWERGFAFAAVDGRMPCGIGICNACLITTHKGLRTRCKDGPVFDLRDLA
ncbi:hypothetical protein OSCT_2856 [Oscillochloris trichoides DG-6]|uniref:Dihydroorotate dehydrogenase electron transfer subunit iron-sulphur cluster binding domain-containing protein n=1 Tax=Oscillochloris trichoides DG-6 TaxID=765420 RepID=E1IHQ5_9CHLR|nr:hypothetical protein [Oscillochloris trichoides]EFO79275.1 hypothetical protein OSCT_2856 [Oscillochloris trichoides DG-6]